MIDVVERAFAAAQADQILDRTDEILVGDDAFREVDIDPELLVDLVTAHASEVIFLRVEKETLQERLRVRDRRRIAGAQLAVDVFQRLFLVVRGILL